MPPNQTYECTALDEVGQCQTWQVVEENEAQPPLDQNEQGMITNSILGIMVLVWLFKMLKKAI